ncbi:MAG TPA: BatD family protein [Gemmatimonadota bacterium]|nr:BatD family protein [Gemmatimonadota bacterium]
MRNRVALLAAAWLLVGATGAAAQEVSAVVEPRLVAVGGVAELTIEVDPGGIRGGVDEPALPALPGQVSIVGRARESRVEMRGLDVRRTVVFRYSLRGLEAGTVRIEPIAVRIGDVVRRTEPLVLLVVGEAGGASAEAGGAPPIFVSARVDRQRAWTGQQITLTFAFYHDPSIPLSESPDYDPPQTPGFWRVELSDEPEISSERVAGRTYQVQRFRYALFPLQAGTAEIGSARVRVVQPDPERWWEPGRPRVLATDPLTVTVDELPQGAPPGFGGAVGRYSLSGGPLPGDATAGSPIELSLIVEGSGNPATVNAPDLPEWPGIDVGSPSVETEPEVDGQRLGGRATFRWILVPRSEGRLTLGEARLPYFDPDAGVYAVDTLRLGELRVSPGPLVGGSQRKEPRGPTLWAARVPREPWPSGLARSPLTWFALAGPWLAWLGLAAWSRRPRGARGGAEGQAEAIVATARRDLEARGALAASDARSAIDRALALRYGSALSGLPSRERRVRLERAGVPEAVVEAAEAARAALEEARFGGVSLELATREIGRLETALADARRGGPSTGSPTKRGAAIVLAALLAVAVGMREARAQDAMTAWSEANRAYQAGEMTAAVRGFEALSQRFDDARIEANLAAALWREGRRGEALARYRAALLLAPRSGAVRRDAERLWTELGDPPREGALRRVLGFVRLDELLLALVIVNGVALAAAIAVRRGRAPALVAAVPCGGVLLLAAAAGLHAWTIERPDVAVAKAAVEIQAAPGGTDVASLPEGALVRVLERGAVSWRVKAAGLPAGWVAPDRIVPLH